jgi:putative spermidine/putrescine transport system substrate-binding protein
MDKLTELAKAEGELTTIALPHDWANYGEIIETYKSKYGMKVNELNPDAGSADELEAIKANKDSKGPQAPDVIDIGLGYTEQAKTDGLVAKYMVKDWETIPLKDPDGFWWAEYYGVLTFEVSKPAVENNPQDWEDLLKPEYKGKVAMAGDVLKSNQAVMTVFASGLSRSGGDIEKAPEAGLQFWKEMNDAGNFIPVIADQGKIAQGETPLVIEWDYLALANRDSLAGNPELQIVVPKTGVLAGPYAGGISAYAPHPYAARLWWEFVMSDEGQLLYLKGYAHPIRFNDMASRNVIPADIAAKLPPADAYKGAVFLTVDELNKSKAYITENWRKVVYGEG